MQKVTRAMGQHRDLHTHARACAIVYSLAISPDARCVHAQVGAMRAWQGVLGVCKYLEGVVGLSLSGRCL